LLTQYCLTKRKEKAMAAAVKKVKGNAVKLHIKRPKVKRPGIHAKTKTSRSKNATNYIKPYVAQGK
jgi:hypothetical protein